MREGDTEGFGGNGRGTREGRRGRERDSGIWVRSVEVNSRNKCRRKMRRQEETIPKDRRQEQMGQTGQARGMSHGTQKIRMKVIQEKMEEYDSKRKKTR